MAPAEAVRPGEDGLIRVEVVHCPRPGVTDSCVLHLPAGTTLAEGVVASGLLQRHGLSLHDAAIGIWGRVQDGSTALRERDRIEIYRPLQVDPKEARRQRYRSAKQKQADKGVHKLPPGAGGAATGG